MEIRLIHGKQPGPRVLISAGVHGDEYESVLACWKLVDVLPKKLIKGTVIIVPVVNENAMIKGSRLGNDKLDLARICPGKINGNSTEKAAAQISNLIEKADYFIDLHTGGKCFNIASLAGYLLHPHNEVLEKQRMMAIAFGLPILWGTDPDVKGRTLSVARDHDVPAIYTEYGGGGKVQEQIIKAYIQGCLNVLAVLNMTRSRRKERVMWKYWLEDHSIDSGYLQGKLPAQTAGIFVPRKRAGDPIVKGECWGNIILPITGEKITINAETAGITLVTRTAGIVNKGDSLGCILPVTKTGRRHIRGK